MPRFTHVDRMSGLLCFVLLFVLAWWAGWKGCFLLGGLTILGGFGMLGDRRRNPWAGFGSLMFGLICTVLGIVLLVYQSPTASAPTTPDPTPAPATSAPTPPGSLRGDESDSRR